MSEGNFASVVTFSQSLSQWAVGILGGSIAVLLSTSNWRPQKLWVRLIYFLFLPAWGLLLFSINLGVKVQENVLAISHLVNPDMRLILAEMNQNLYGQLRWMQVALVILCVWLVAYLCWWIFGRDQDPAAKKGMA
jgi:hypothetical protein